MAAHYVCSDCGAYFTANGTRVTADALVLYAFHTYHIDNCDEENSWKECSCGKKDEDSITAIVVSDNLNSDAIAPVVDEIVAPAEDAVVAPTNSLSAAPADEKACATVHLATANN